MNRSFTLNIVVASLLFVSCDSMLNGSKESEIPELGESLEPIEGADNSTLTVNINSEYDAWCIDVWKKIDSNNGIYQNIELYSTYLVEANYRDFDYESKGSRFAVVAKMPLEV